MEIFVMLIASAVFALMVFELFVLNKLCGDIENVRIEVEKLKNEKALDEARMYGITSALDILFVKMNKVEQRWEVIQ